MIFPVLFIVLCARLTGSLFVGDACHLTDNTPGTCALVFSCPSVLADLLAGSTPDTICGYDPQHVDPIICCPAGQPGTNTSADPTQITRVQTETDGRGQIAKRKCGEYAKFVYTKKFSPFWDRVEVNVSQCAVKAIPLITGGEKADRMEFPHMTAVGYNLTNGSIGWYCGGTLISENFVLTAAHCTYLSGSGNASWVRVGDLNLASSDDQALPEQRRIVDRIRHPDYKLPAQYHDIALLRLESRVPFNAWIRPACLHTAPETGTQRAIATGWGKVDWFNDEGSNHLLKVTLSLVDSNTCLTRWNSAPKDYKLPNGPDAQSSLCAGELGKDTCQGDSGGPLVIFSDRKFYCMYDVVGITSLGKVCGVNFPGIYTRVYHYVSWIESVVWPQG